MVQLIILYYTDIPVVYEEILTISLYIRICITVYTVDDSVHVVLYIYIHYKHIYIQATCAGIEGKQRHNNLTTKLCGLSWPCQRV